MYNVKLSINYTIGNVKFWRAERDGIVGYGDTEELALRNLKYWEYEDKKRREWWR